jgi:hypothetical protein
MRLVACGGNVTIHPVPERDPKSHPLAAVSRWSNCRRPFPLDHVALPEKLSALREQLDGLRVETIRPPASLRELASHVIGKAWVVDPAWVERLRLTWTDLEKVAAGSWALVDLQTTASLHSRGGLAQTETVVRRSPHGIMSARVEYFDVATCGFALMDVVPYGIYSAGASGFSTRVLRANRSWKRYAGECGFAMLLSSQTPREKQCNDVLSATKAVGQGEIVATDLPWLAAGTMGGLLAPRLTRHLLRAHLGASVDDRVQFWNRWDETRISVRDIADLARRFPPLRAVRFAGGEGGTARLGLELRCACHAEGRVGRMLIQTGRIDFADAHDGMPPEPMMIFMKWLAREHNEQTAWARKELAGRSVIWQFDTTEGQKYATLYEAARDDTTSAKRLTLRKDSIPIRLGVLGDGSHEYQADLTRRIVEWIADSPAAAAS